MPEAEPRTEAEDGPAASTPETDNLAAGPAPVLSPFGVASAVLAVVSIAAVVLVVLIWNGHREDGEALDYQARVAQAAVDWAGVLINMSKDNIDSSLEKLHDGTVGELNNDFEAAMLPYRAVVQRLQSKTTGQINSVSIEAVHHNLDGPPPTTAPQVPDFASRTDTVLIVATSVSQNANAKPQTVHWNLRLGVSNVEGRLLISRLELIR